MPIFGVTAVVVQRGRVLLQLREDTATWCLPGGAIEAGESLAQAAVREVREETGLEVALEGLVGVYSKPRWRRGGGHDIVFRARPIGGALSQTDPAETLEVRFFAPDALPERFWWTHRRMLADALSGATGVAVALDAVWPFPQEIDRGDLRALAAHDPGVAPRVLDALCVHPGPQAERPEVPPPAAPEAPRGRIAETGYGAWEPSGDGAAGAPRVGRRGSRPL
jgi:ADP-ribose pyrophosphatase YjhB (NUDIX family)